MAHIDEAFHRAIFGDLVSCEVLKDFLTQHGNLVQEFVESIEVV